MTASVDPPARPQARPTDPSVDRRLAMLHLRMGQLGLARAELESLAGSGNLDDPGLLALAEARWRTGDLAGAGEAAQAYLDAGGDATTALVIAAEAISAVGRPGEARRLAARAMERADVPLDRIFAGMPRSMVWPVDPADAGLPVGTLFPTDEPRGSRRSSPAAPEAPVATPDEPAGPGLWDAEPDAATAERQPDGAAELDLGRAAIEGGRLAEGTLRLAIALRAAPELAPAILDATATTDPRTAEIEILRGDAFRLVGHELDARRAYTAAAAALGATDAMEPPGEPAEAGVDDEPGLQLEPATFDEPPADPASSPPADQPAEETS